MRDYKEEFEQRVAYIRGLVETSHSKLQRHRFRQLRRQGLRPGGHPLQSSL